MPDWVKTLQEMAEGDLARKKDMKSNYRGWVPDLRYKRDGKEVTPAQRQYLSHLMRRRWKSGVLRSRR